MASRGHHRLHHQSHRSRGLDAEVHLPDDTGAPITSAGKMEQVGLQNVRLRVYGERRSHASCAEERPTILVLEGAVVCLRVLNTDTRDGRGGLERSVVDVRRYGIAIAIVRLQEGILATYLDVQY